MTEQERISARRHLKLQEQLKEPVLKKAYELSKNKSKKENRRKEILEIWGRHGHYVSPENEKRLNEVQETAQQERMKNALKNYM